MLELNSKIVSFGTPIWPNMIVIITYLLNSDIGVITLETILDKTYSWNRHLDNLVKVKIVTLVNCIVFDD